MRLLQWLDIILTLFEEVSTSPPLQHRVIFYLALLLHTKRDTQHVEISELTSVPLFEVSVWIL